MAQFEISSSSSWVPWPGVVLGLQHNWARDQLPPHVSFWCLYLCQFPIMNIVYWKNSLRIPYFFISNHSWYPSWKLTLAMDMWRSIPLGRTPRSGCWLYSRLISIQRCSFITAQDVLFSPLYRFSLQSVEISPMLFTRNHSTWCCPHCSVPKVMI